MEIFQTILTALSIPNLLVLLFGTVVGIIIGALPGLGPTFAIALLLPMTFTMKVDTALIFLAAVYSSTVYGGSISAILLNIPGHPGAVCTTMDGYPMAREGKAGEALGAATTASLVGGIIGFIALIVLGPHLAVVALKFSPADYFWLVISGLSLVALTSKELFLKGLLLSFLGMASSMVGFDAINGNKRFTFGFTYLEDGFNFVAVSVGLFAIAQVFLMFEDNKTVKADIFAVNKVSTGFFDTFRHWFVTLRSSIIGAIVGIIPGIGMSSASFFSYVITQRFSKNPEKIGKGDVRGILASEASNNACVGGALVPALALGIPGGAGAAMYIVALTIHGVSPGLSFYRSPFIPVLLVGMILAQIAFFAAGMLGGSFFAKLTRVSSAILIPLTLVFSYTGDLSIRGAQFDMWVGLLFGVIGYVFAKAKWPMSCFVLGALLGPMLEQNFFRALRLSNGSYSIFFSSPISICLALFALAVILFSVIPEALKVNKNKK